MRFPQILRMPKVQLALLLFFIALFTLFKYPLLVVTKILFLSIFFTVGFDLLFTFLRKHIFFVPYSGIITGLILGLTMNPHLGWWSIFLISFLAIASKHVIKINNRHIFNPAAFGLVLGNILLGDTVSWWRVSSVTFLILLLPLLVSGIRMKRFGSIGAFIFTYSLLLLLLQNVSPRSILRDSTVLFFAITMLPEPMTSPVALQRQVLYGGFVASLATLYFYLPFTRNLLSVNLLPDGLLPFLLLGNLVFFKFR